MDSQKQNKLTAGDNITIEGDVISATGGGSVTEYGTTAEFEEQKDQFEVGTEYLITDDYEQPETYSEEETLIGTYLEKPLYRRVLHVVATTATYQMSLAPYNIKYLIDVKGVTEDGAHLPFSHPTASYNIALFGSPASLQLIAGSNMTSATVNKNTQVTLEYTKTTD